MRDAKSQPTGSRERVLASIDLTEPDRIPIDYWAVAEVTDRLIEHFGLQDKEELLRRLNVDLRYFQGPSLVGQQQQTLDDGLVQDHWGVVRRTITVDGTDKLGRPWTWDYKHVHSSPLAASETVQQIEQYSSWPTADLWDYSGVKEQAQRIREAGYAAVFGGDRLDRTAQLKPATYVRGMEQFLVDLMINPEIAECILERIVNYYLEYNERVFQAAEGTIDIFFMGDDMGTQNSLWVSRDIYRRFFKENFRKFNALAHSYGVKTMYHTCGAVSELVPDFIDCGLDILQSIQPASIDLAALKREYGRDLAFQGGIDIQKTMPKGEPEDVRREVRQRAETLGTGGGYIFCTSHNLLPDVPTENIAALFAAYLEFGQQRSG